MGDGEGAGFGAGPGGVIEVELNWEDPADRGGLFQKAVFSEIPRSGDEVIFDYGDADAPHDGRPTRKRR